MANEFKVKKGLIIEGASGGAALDVQGSQGQLFSVTDNLSGSIFAVSDISGVPILDINSSGVSYFGGDVGIGTASPDGILSVSDGTYDTLRVNNGTSHLAGTRLYRLDSEVGSSNAWMLDATGNSIIIGPRTGTVQFTVVDTSENVKFIVDDGDVGIGTTAPSSPLHIKSTANQQIHLSDDSDATSNGMFLGYDSSGSTLSYIGSAYNSNSSRIDFRTKGIASSDTKMTILGSGNVGIGTTSPAYPLDIVGFANSTNGFRVTDGTIDNRVSWVSGNVGFFGTISNHPISFNTNSAERMRILAGGNVGIGIASPASKLHTSSSVSELTTIGVQTTSGSVGKLAGIGFATSGSSGKYKSAIGHITTSAAHGVGAMVFCVDGVADANPVEIGDEAMRIDASGNVGIGTDSPTNILHTITSSNTVGRFESTDSDSHIRINDTDDSFYIGTASQKGYIGGSIGISSSNINIDLTNGNVGIGTTTPGEVLDVVGNIAVSGTVDGIDIATRDAVLTSTTTTAGAALPKAGGTMTGAVKFSSTTYGAESSENFFRIKLQDVGGVYNDVGIGQTASNNLGFNTTAGGTFTFNDGTNGNVLTISDGQATFDGEIEAASLDINGAAAITGALTVGVNDAGHDVVFYGNTANKKVMWDTSVDHLKLYDNTKIVFGTGGAEADYDGSIYWDQTDLVIDSESVLQILSDAIVTGDVTATGLDINGNADISGSITNATWAGDVIPSNKLDTDTAHLSVVQSFTGQKTFSAGIVPSFVKHSTSGSATADYGPGSEILFGISNESTTAGAIYVLKSGVWTLMNADTPSDCQSLTAVAVGGNSGQDGMLIRGCITLGNAYVAGTDAEGIRVFASTTDGKATLTAPSSSGDTVRVLGYSLNSGSKKMFFTPDNTHIEIA